MKSNCLTELRPESFRNSLLFTLGNICFSSGSQYFSTIMENKKSKAGATGKHPFEMEAVIELANSQGKTPEQVLREIRIKNKLYDVFMGKGWDLSHLIVSEFTELANQHAMEEDEALSGAANAWIHRLEKTVLECAVIAQAPLGNLVKPDLSKKQEDSILKNLDSAKKS